jgi:mono/diheme cytochrome c family protein
LNKNFGGAIQKNPFLPLRQSRVFGGLVLLFLLVLMAVSVVSAKPQGSGDAEKGKQLFASAGCGNCHGSTAKGISGLGPLITPPPFAIPEFLNYLRHPSGTMRAFSKEELTDEQLGDIHAFLKSLSPPSDAISLIANLTGNADTGKRLFKRDGCYECHGILGQGSTGYGPRIGPDPISMQGILNYLRNPSGNMPPYSAKIVSNQDVADIYAYLKSVPRPVNIQKIPRFTK